MQQAINGREIGTYRVFFRDEDNQICGREDFAADTALAATRIARTLADACSDVCCTFELWDGEKLISAPIKADDIGRLEARHQEIVVHTEETIRHSNWRIAESRRLIERLASKCE
jgi:hypothetical protein